MKKIKWDIPVYLLCTLAILFVAGYILLDSPQTKPPQAFEMETESAGSSGVRAPNDSGSSGDGSDGRHVSSKKQTGSSRNESGKTSSEESGQPPVTNPGMINLNTAAQEQLMSLDGIGEVLAGRIIALRNEIGGFQSIEELMAVEGIGEKKFAAIRSRITV